MGYRWCRNNQLDSPGLSGINPAGVVRRSDDGREARSHGREARSDRRATMTLRELRYLVALANRAHFGRAAEDCHVSQPTLSTQIRKLEEYLGVTLIERNAKSFALTPIGQDVVEKARQIVTQV